jgi:hypothetical protein
MSIRCGDLGGGGGHICWHMDRPERKHRWNEAHWEVSLETVVRWNGLQASLEIKELTNVTEHNIDTRMFYAVLESRNKSQVMPFKMPLLKYLKTKNDFFYRSLFS